MPETLSRRQPEPTCRLYLPRSGRGPGILLALGSWHAEGEALAQRLADDGYLVLLSDAEDDTAIAGAFETLASHAGRLGHGAALAGEQAADAVLSLCRGGRLAALVLLDVLPEPSALERAACPIMLHVAVAGSPERARAAARIAAAPTDPDGVSVYVYAEDRPGSGVAPPPLWTSATAALVYPRLLALLRRTMGPHYDLDDLWEQHLACEFVTKDPDANMRTMVAHPYVNHVPTMTGGVGHDGLKRFYTYHFIGKTPRDRCTIPISRTVGVNRIVEEKVFCFTHDAELDWLLPGVAPTGRYVEIPLVAIITFQGDKLCNEHIYWDQASVLAQVGLIDPTGLPIAGVAEARKLLDKTLPSNTLMPNWATSEGKPI